MQNSESEITSSGSTDSHLDPVVSSASTHSEYLCTEDISSQHSTPSSSYEVVQYDSEAQNLLPVNHDMSASMFRSMSEQPHAELEGSFTVSLGA